MTEKKSSTRALSRRAKQHWYERLRDLDIVKAEWRHFFRHPKLMITMFAVIFIPMLYAGFFLGGVWDPYGKTSELPVAVVNDDAGAEFQEKTVRIGDEIVKNLSQNDKMSWQFVDNETAKNGIASGAYFMLVHIPGDFSHNVLSITEANPEKSIIYYETTPAKNYIASMISRSAATTLEHEIAKTITEEYGNVIIKQFGEITDGMTKAARGADALTQGLAAARHGSNSLAGGTQQLSAGSDTLTQGLAELQRALPQDAALQELKSGLDRYETAVATLDASLHQPLVDDNLTKAEETTNRLSEILASLKAQLDTIEQKNISTQLTQLKQMIADNPSLSDNEKNVLLTHIDTVLTNATQLQQTA